MTAEILRIIEENHLFAGLNGDLLHEIAASATKTTLGSGQFLFRKGDRANAMWGVLSGLIETRVTADDGKELVLDVFEAGDVFGEVGVLDFGPRPVDAVAESRTVLFRLERRQFLKYLHSSPELCFRMFSLLCSDLRESTAALEDTALYTLPGRLAKKLVSLANHNQDSATEPLVPGISHNDLARLLGVHRVSVSRQLSQWEKAGFLSSGRQRIKIRNLQALVDLAAPGQDVDFDTKDWGAVSFSTESSQGFRDGDLLINPKPSSEPEYRGILAVDAAEYSKSLVNDAARTFKRLEAGMIAIDKAISDGGGRLISHSGDRVLAEFQSVDKAYEAALSIHERVDSLGILGSSHTHSVFRIGVHYGEVQANDHVFSGKTVNTAIGLTQLARSGGISISAAVRDTLKNREQLELQFVGDHELKNVPGTVPVYSARKIPMLKMLALRAETLVPRRFRPAALAVTLIVLLAGFWFTGDHMGRQNAPLAVSQLSIAVLPFTSSGDSELSFLADGIPEVVRTSLSTIPGMRVIGRASSGYFKDRTASTTEIARVLKVAWLLRGGLTNAEDEIHATAQLLNAVNNEVVWEEQFEMSGQNPVALGSDIGRRIAVSLGVIDGDGTGLPQLLPLTSNAQAHALYLQAQSHIWQGRQRNHIKAVPLLQLAVELDPSFAEAHAVLAGLYRSLTLLDEQAQYNPELRQELARQSLQEAISLKPDSSIVLAEASKMRSFDSDHEGALALAERALRIDPNNYQALQSRFWIQSEQGDQAGALQSTERMMQLEPLSVYAMNVHADQLFDAYRYRESLAVANRALALYPENEVPHAHAWAAKSKLKLGDRLGAIESSRKAMPYGAPYDLWTGLEYDWEFFDDIDPLRAAVGLVYVEQYDQIRQILIDAYDVVEANSDVANSYAYLNTLDYLVNQGTLEALAGNFEAAVEFFTKAKLMTSDDDGGLIRAPVIYQVLEWSRQSHWSLALLFTYRNSGKHKEADIIAAQLEDLVAGDIEAGAKISDLADYQLLYLEAQYHAIEGRRSEALDKLRTWVDYGVDIFTYIKWDPFLESLHGDPEFEAIVAEVEAELAAVRVQYHARQAALAETGEE